MTAPTYHRYGDRVVRADLTHGCSIAGTRYDKPCVPAVVLTASDEDVERLARACAKAAGCDPVTWTTWRESARRMLADLLTPPIPPEPTDRSVRLADKHDYEWALRSDGEWASLHGTPLAYAYADLWAERGPLREVE